MNVKKSLLAVSAFSILGIAGFAGPRLVSAEASAGDSNLISKIAQKFNLKEGEVKAVFEENKTARKTERQAEQSGRLQKAVDDGDITAEQKTKIEAKLKELKAARETAHDELEKWATDNKIDSKFLMGDRSGNNDRLQNAVDDGSITAEQKTLIETKQKELKDRREAAHDSLEQWAEDNDIDEKYLHGLGKGGHGGRGGFGRQ